MPRIISRPQNGCLRRAEVPDGHGPEVPGRHGIAVSIATKDCNTTIARAVASVLEQCGEDAVVVVTSDGDGSAPFDAIGRSRGDRRLFLVEHRESRGPYFAHDVVLRAAPTGLFAIQDADDRSLDQRFSRLTNILVDERADAAFGGLRQVGLDGSTEVRHAQSWSNGRLPHLVDHFGVFRRDSLLTIGGYYGATRFGYDSFVTSVLAAFGHCVAVDDVLYERRERAGSLTRSPKTGFPSKAREETVVELDSRYQALLRGDVQLSELRNRYVSAAERAVIDRQASELGEEIRKRRRRG